MAGVRDKVREFALSLPEALEDHPWGEDVVKVRGKIFVFLGGSASKRITVKVEESHAHALSIEGAEPAGYGLGASGWVTVPLRADGISIALLRDWVEESYLIVAPKRLAARLVDAIEEAKAGGGEADKLAEAERLLARGDTRLATGRFKDAVAAYKDALSKAEGA